jgi:hypothetical protein
MVFVLRTAWLVTGPHIDLYPPTFEGGARGRVQGVLGPVEGTAWVSSSMGR